MTEVVVLNGSLAMQLQFLLDSQTSTRNERNYFTCLRSAPVQQFFEQKKKLTYLKSSFISLNHLSNRGPSWPAAVRALRSETIFGSLRTPPAVFEPSILLFLLLSHDLFALNSTRKETNKRKYVNNCALYNCPI